MPEVVKEAFNYGSSGLSREIPGARGAIAAQRLQDKIHGTNLAADMKLYEYDTGTFGQEVEGLAAKARGAATARGVKAQSYEEQMAKIAREVATREGPKMDMARANEARARGLEAIGMQSEAALGGAPSAAQIQGFQAMDEAVRMQQAQIAGARGPSGLTMAQQAAGAGLAGQQLQATGATGLARAQETAAARSGMGGLATGMRDMDYGGAMRQADLEMQQRDLNARAQMEALRMGTQGGLEYRGIGLQDELEYERMRQEVFEQQLQAQMAMEGIRLTGEAHASDLAYRERAANARATQQNVMTGLGGLMGGFSAWNAARQDDQPRPKY
jgi:hypothetical protein